jgi:hypothetical protein
MRMRAKIGLLGLTLLMVLSIAIGGCGKKDETVPQTPEQQKMREDKKGD